MNMRVPVYGNNAYQYDNVQPARPAIQSVPKVRRGVQKKKKVSVGSVALLGIAVLMAFGLLFRYAQILESTTKVKALQSELNAVQAQVVAKQFAIERNLDLGKIEEEAITRLGMQRPTKAQTVYLDMGNCDYAECAKAKTSQGRNIFSVLKNSVLAYFG